MEEEIAIPLSELIDFDALLKSGNKSGTIDMKELVRKFKEKLPEGAKLKKGSVKLHLEEIDINDI